MTTTDTGSFYDLLEARLDTTAKTIHIDETLGRHVRDLLALINVRQLPLTDATLDPEPVDVAAPQIVRGTARLWDITGVSVILTFGTADARPFATIEARLPGLDVPTLSRWLFPLEGQQAAALSALRFDQSMLHASTQSGKLTVTGALDQRWAIPGLDSLPLPGLQLAVTIQTDPYDLPTCSALLMGTFKLQTAEIPIAITIPLGIGPWSAGIVPPGASLPTLSDLGALVGGREIVGALPADLQTMTALRLTHLMIRFDPTRQTWDSIDIGIATASVWSLAPRVSVERLGLQLSLRPTTPGLGSAGLIYHGSAYGLLKVGSLNLAASIALPLSGQLRLEAYTSEPLPGLREFSALIDADFAAALPERMGNIGSLQLKSLSVDLDLGEKRLVGCSIDIASAGTWEVIPGHLALDDLRFQLSAEQFGGSWGVTGLLAGAVTIEGVRVAVAVERPSPGGGWLFGLTEPLALPGLAALVDLVGGSYLGPFLPQDMDRNLGALTISTFQATFGGTALALTDLDLEIRTDHPWPIVPGYLSLESCTLDLHVAQPTDGTSRQITGGIAGRLAVGHIALLLRARKARADEAWRFQGALDPSSTINLSSLIGSLLPDGLTLPDEFPDIEFSNIAIDVTPATGAFDLRGSSTVSWTLPFGVSGLLVSQGDLVLTRRPATDAGETTGRITCSITLTVQGPVTITDGLVFSSMTLIFDLDQPSRTWTLSGTVAGRVLDVGVELGASLEQTPTARTLTFASSITATRPLIDFGIGTLDCKGLTLRISKALQPAASAGVRLSDDSAYTWEIGTTSSLVLTDYLALSGTLALFKQETSVGLSFKPTQAKARINLPVPGAPVGFHIELGHLAFLATTREHTTTWAISVSTKIWLSDLPDRIQRLVATPVAATLSVGSNGLDLTVTDLCNVPDFTIPTIDLGVVNLDLGRALVTASQLKLAINSGGLTFSLAIGFGIPEKMNNIFGVDGDTPQLEFFNTYPDSTIRLNLECSTAGGLSLRLLDSPIRLLHLYDEGGVTFCDLDLGAYGKLRGAVPTFKYDGVSFTLTDVRLEEVVPLKIPMWPLKALLQQCGLDHSKIPAGYPVRELALYDPTTKTFQFSEFLELLHLQEQRETLRFVEERFELLPDQFKVYLSPPPIPRSFALDLVITPDGSARGKVAVGQDAPLKLLFPMGPYIGGLTIYSLTFGELFGGSMLRLDLNVVLDRFSLLEMGTALLLPVEKLAFLPRTQDLHNRIIVRDLFMIIFYQGGVPIPVPLFFTDLGYDYLGLEGVEMKFHLGFPKPQPDLRDAAKIIKDFQKFFTDPTYLLDARTPPQKLDLKLKIGPAYVQLPKYMGAKLLGMKEVVEISAYQYLAHVLNAVKTLSPNELIQAVPLSYRVGSVQIDFSTIRLGVTWLVTTPKEFIDVTHTELGMVDEQSAYLLQAMPYAPTAETRGLVVLLKGSLNLGAVTTLETQFGLVVTDRSLATGLYVSGTVANVLALKFQGQVVISDKHTDVFQLTGSSYLQLFGRDIFSGTLLVTEKRFSYQGTFNLFPNGPLTVKGSLSGEMSDDSFRLAGDLTFALGSSLTLASASAELTHDHFRITATWLSQHNRFTFAVSRLERSLLFEATMGVIDLGFLRITDPVNRYTGPSAQLQLFDDQSFTLAMGCTISLLNIIDGSGGLRVTRDGFSMYASTTIFFGWVTFGVVVTGSTLHDRATYRVELKWNDDMLRFIAAETEKNARIKRRMTDQEWAEYQRKVREINEELARYTRQLRDRTRELEDSIRSQVATARAERDRLQAALDALVLQRDTRRKDQARRQVRELEQQIATKNAEIDARRQAGETPESSGVLAALMADVADLSTRLDDALTALATWKTQWRLPDDEMTSSLNDEIALAIFDLEDVTQALAALQSSTAVDTDPQLREYKAHMERLRDQLADLERQAAQREVSPTRLRSFQIETGLSSPDELRRSGVFSDPSLAGIDETTLLQLAFEQDVARETVTFEGQEVTVFTGDLDELDRQLQQGTLTVRADLRVKSSVARRSFIQGGPSSTEVKTFAFGFDVANPDISFVQLADQIVS